VVRIFVIHISWHLVWCLLWLPTDLTSLFYRSDASRFKSCFSQIFVLLFFLLIIICLDVCIIVVCFVLRNPCWYYEIIVPFRLGPVTFWSNNSFFPSCLSSRWQLIILLIIYTRSNIVIILILIAILRLILTFIIKVFLMNNIMMGKLLLFIFNIFI
jgi:hypothetical protein